MSRHVTSSSPPTPNHHPKELSQSFPLPWQEYALSSTYKNNTERSLQLLLQWKTGLRNTIAIPNTTITTTSTHRTNPTHGCIFCSSNLRFTSKKGMWTHSPDHSHWSSIIAPRVNFPRAKWYNHDVYPRLVLIRTLTLVFLSLHLYHFSHKENFNKENSSLWELITILLLLKIRSRVRHQVAIMTTLCSSKNQPKWSQIALGNILTANLSVQLRHLATPTIQRFAATRANRDPKLFSGIPHKLLTFRHFKTTTRFNFAELTQPVAFIFHARATTINQQSMRIQR